MADEGYFGTCPECGAIIAAASQDLPRDVLADLVADMIRDGLDIVRMPNERFRTDPNIRFGCRCDEGQPPLPMEEQ